MWSSRKKLDRRSGPRFGRQAALEVLEKRSTAGTPCDEKVVFADRSWYAVRHRHSRILRLATLLDAPVGTGVYQDSITGELQAYRETEHHFMECTTRARITT